jgi:hypothetical protein
MSFVKVENFDRIKDHIGDDKFSTVSFEGNNYIIKLEVLPDDNILAYRVVNDDGRTTTVRATEIKNRKTLDRLRDTYFSGQP